MFGHLASNLETKSVMLDIKFCINCGESDLHILK